MKEVDVKTSIDLPMLKSNLKPDEKPKLLSDNGSCNIANGFKDYTQKQRINTIEVVFGILKPRVK